MWITNGLHVLVGAIPLLLAANLCLSVLGTQAGFVLDAYRLVQMDVDGSPVGSRSVRLSQVMVCDESAQMNVHEVRKSCDDLI